MAKAIAGQAAIRASSRRSRSPAPKEPSRATTSSSRSGFATSRCTTSSRGPGRSQGREWPTGGCSPNWKGIDAASEAARDRLPFLPRATMAGLAALVSLLGPLRAKGTATPGYPRVSPSRANPTGTCSDVALCAQERNAGQADSCRLLAVTYEFGKGGAGRNEPLAATYYDRACALGNPPGSSRRDRYARVRERVPKNPAEASSAYSRACTLGWKVGCTNWERLKAALSPPRTLLSDAVPTQALITPNLSRPMANETRRSPRRTVARCSRPTTGNDRFTP